MHSPVKGHKSVRTREQCPLCNARYTVKLRKSTRPVYSSAVGVAKGVKHKRVFTKMNRLGVAVLWVVLIVFIFVFII